MQPTYLPWLGYFELMAHSDTFVYFDDVQFVKKSWHHRNKIKSPSGELMLSISVKSGGESRTRISQALIDNNSNWRKKHFTSIDLNYKKAPYYNKYINGLADIYNRDFEKLLDVDVALIEFFKQELGISTPTVFSSDLHAYGERNEKIVNICKKLKADVLYDAQGAEEILNLDIFKANNIKCEFQHFQHPVYHQQHGDFISHLSVIDLLMNEGEKSLNIILSGNETTTEN